VVSSSALPAAHRGLDPLDADATAALARFATDAWYLERASGNRVTAAPIIRAFAEALATGAVVADVRSTHDPWIAFYLLLDRFTRHAIALIDDPQTVFAGSVIVRFEQILTDDFAHGLFTSAHRRRLRRRIAGD